MNNEQRQGRLTSSRIHVICADGRSKSPITGVNWSAPALTYFEEKRIERRMQTCLDVDGAYSQPMAWGNFMELVLFNILGLEYKIESKETRVHPSKSLGEVWAGSRDLIVPGVKVGEIKCYQKKKFALYTDCLMLKDVELLKKQFPQEYWQMVSNAAIERVSVAEAISYMPYESEMEEIREMVRDYDGDDIWKYRFICEKPNSQLPVLKDGGYYSNITKFEFEVPQDDLDLLNDRVTLAKKEIITQ